MFCLGMHLARCKLRNALQGSHRLVRDYSLKAGARRDGEALCLHLTES